MSDDLFDQLLKEKNESVAVKIDEKRFQSAKKKAIGPRKIETHIMIPPSLARISFNKNAKMFSKIPARFKAPKILLPEYWANYDPRVSKYSQYVSRPENQQKCGSCFAFACASVINDVFIFGRKLKFNPDISPLSILSCVKDKTSNLQCDGGDPLGVLDYIVRNGITTNKCMNYHQTCSAIPSCYQPIKKAFDEAKRDQVFKSSNSAIKLPPCGCCPGCNNNFSYYINQPILISENTATNIEGRSDAVYNIKQHLYIYGGAVTGYIVYANFVHDKSNGKFEKTRGIYIESENYCPDPIIENGKKKLINPKEFMGCHAVSIVGWGIEKNPIKLDDGTVLKQTPYWIARNSWSDKWGLKGYFKMAMYQKIDKKEINQTCAFERINNVTISGQRFQIGGTLIFTPKRFVPYNNNRKDCKSKEKCSEPSPIENREILKTTVGDITKDEENVEENKVEVKKVKATSNTKNILFYSILGIIVVIFIFSFGYFLSNSKKRRNKK
jgi:hypothetical protein